MSADSFRPEGKGPFPAVILSGICVVWLSVVGVAGGVSTIVDKLVFT